MATKDFIVFDFETGGKDPYTCQPTQLAALAIDGRTLKLKGEFNTEIRAEIDDEKAIAAGLGPLEERALEITGKTREGIDKAPELQPAWNKFVAFVNKYNWKGTSWFAPIPAGYNIINYDMPIIERLCKKYGPYNKKKGQQELFNPIFKVDMLDNVFMWTENDPDVRSISMDTMRDRMGLSKENSHDALQDVKDTANIMIKFLKTHRAVYRKMEIDNAFAKGGLYIE